MDILILLQSARRHKIFYGCVENVPKHTLSHVFTETTFARDLLLALSFFEEKLNDSFYIAGYVDKSFCNRKVTLSISFDDFCRRACGLGETSSID